MENAVIECLEVLQRDKDFQEDLKHPLVVKALKHWTNEVRLPQEEADTLFNDDFRVKNVFMTIKRLENICRLVPMKVPLKAVIAGSTDPFYGIKFQKNDETVGEEHDKKIDKKVRQEWNEENEASAREDAVFGEKLNDNPIKNEHEMVNKTQTADKGSSEIFRSYPYMDISLQNIIFWWSIQIVIIALLLRFLF